MTPSPSSTLNAPAAPGARAEDPELLALPAPPKRERTVTVALMLVTALAAVWMSVSLSGEARYALTSGRPADVGELTRFQPARDLANTYVRGAGLLGTQGAIRYGRAAEGDSFRLAPVAGNPKLWVEIRVPEGFEGPRYVPPTSFAGRLVPFERAGVRHTGLAATVRERTGVVVPEDAWLLVDGSSPRTARWAVALVALFLAFAAWNLGGVARILPREKDGAERGGAGDQGEAAAGS
ncbi:MAG TPA: hypothetical protein VHB21_04645 [Minicystis sp.]|nr:hypothetical protein [Minicystis sp.]